MRSRLIHKFTYYCVALFLFSGCAVIIPPTGGPKDVTPPKVVEYLPDNKSTHFTGHKIKITFDEYIQLKSLDKQLIVSPPLKYPPVPFLNGKVLQLTIKDTLKKNSTYTFNFGNSIIDNNEGNQLKNFQYIVSTGDHIDSLSITGNMQDAFTHDPVKNAYVMLYSDESDSAPFKKLPTYIGLTDDQGNYRIENIAGGEYRLIGISNVQSDYLYHPYVEGIAFKSKLTEIDGRDTANLNIFYEVEPRLKLLSSKAVDRGAIMLVFNKPATNISVKRLNMADSLKPTYTYFNYSSTGDTAFYWFNTPFIDSLRFVVSANNKVLDTGFVHSFPNNNIARHVKKPKPTRLKITTNIHGGFDYHQPVVFSFAEPVLKYNLNKILFTLNSDSVKFKADTGGLPLNLAINPAKTLLSDSTYKLIILPGAFTDMFGSTNDTIKYKFGVLEPSYFGSLKLSVVLSMQGNFILELLNDKNAVCKYYRISGSQTIFFDALQPGTYRVRLINDANNNGVWDAGDFLKSVQPEKVYYYPQSIAIRSNWDLVQSWEVK